MKADGHVAAQEPAAQPERKKAYGAPRLTVLGTLEQLVRGVKGSGPADVGAFSILVVSDRDLKERFEAVDSREVIARVASLPIRTWNYKDEDLSIRHIGPMAQDFAAAFGVGGDDRHIHVFDASGVAFAAIQALHQILQQQAEQLAALRAELAELERRTGQTEAMTAAAPRLETPSRN